MGQRVIKLMRRQSNWRSIPRARNVRLKSHRQIRSGRRTLVRRSNSRWNPQVFWVFYDFISFFMMFFLNHVLWCVFCVLNHFYDVLFKSFFCDVFKWFTSFFYDVFLCVFINHFLWCVFYDLHNFLWCFVVSYAVFMICFVICDVFLYIKCVCRRLRMALVDVVHYHLCGRAPARRRRVLLLQNTAERHGLTLSPW